MKPLLVVKTGTTLPELRERRGDYEQWFEDGLELERMPLEVVAAHEGEALPRPDRVGGIVITGSSAMVSEREPWSERTAAWLRGAVRAEVPILGVCYGHQLLAHALGGEVGTNPRGREIGTVEVDLSAASGDRLLDGLGPRCLFNATHVESVLRLPPRSIRLASNAADPNHAFALAGRPRRIWGVQFHPEFDDDVMRAYLHARRAILAEEGLDADALLAAARATPAGATLLGRFARLVEGLPESGPR
ncbi:MAG: glutamine amidotransferase [Myxococcota bacterium]|nr:glutamine amidotransferase [Myxococcota bacterium]